MRQTTIQVRWEGKASRLPMAYDKRVIRRIFTSAPDKVEVCETTEVQDALGVATQVTLQLADSFSDDDIIAVIEHRHLQGESTTGFGDFMIPLSFDWSEDRYRAYVEVGPDYDFSTTFYPERMKKWLKQVAPIARRLLRQSSATPWGIRHVLVTCRCWWLFKKLLRLRGYKVPDVNEKSLLLPLGNREGQVDFLSALTAVRFAQCLGPTPNIVCEPLPSIGIKGLQEIDVA